MTATDYPHLPETAREEIRGAARARAEQATEDYADLLAGEAGVAAREVFPTAARLVFRLSNDVFGATATLVAAYAADGQQLWHTDTGDEWPDESRVTDHLAGAADLVDEYFPTVSTRDLADAGDELYALDLTTSRALNSD
ncbi:MAG TPA: hypothetical protein VJT31_39645 [Rugosimonospora sp.]|nr:hypothetical protein [Rugosimonospora sp.]